MKRYLFAALAIMLIFTACNRKSFVKKLVGTWGFDRYQFEGKDKTMYFDTTFRYYDTFQEESSDGKDSRYSVSYQQFILREDSLITADTLGYDSVTLTWLVQSDTLRYIDTSIVPRMETGTLDLINSEEDLQMRNDSDITNPTIYRILELDKSTLTVRKGNEEYTYKKK